MFTILNREYQPSQENDFHLVPLGDFPGVMHRNGEDINITQRFDEPALQAIVKNFRPKVLVDFEHRSMSEDGDTTAAAWIPSIHARPDGLGCPLEFTDIGAAAVKNKRIRFLSPAFDVEMIDEGKKICRPTRLISVGLTNRPNLKTLAPLTNREPPAGGCQTGAHNATAANAASNEEESMKGVIALLGLKEGSDETTVLNSVKELMAAKTDLTAANARIAELEGAVLNKEADEFLAKHAGRIKNKDAVKAQFVKNKADTIAMFEALAEVPEKTATVHNRAGAKTPEGAAPVTNKAGEQANFIQQVRNREKCGYKAAFNMARAEKPELFKKEAEQD